MSLQPFRRLRARIALPVVIGIAVLAFGLSQLSAVTLTAAYRDAARSELEAVAATWEDGFEESQLARPRFLQRRLELLQQRIPRLHKVSLSWHDGAGRTLVASAGHEHDPDGVKRDVTTAVVAPSTAGVPAPVDSGEAGYREVRAADGAHYGELNRPIRLDADGTPRVALELHYDLKELDVTSARAIRTVAVAAVLAAVTAALLVSVLLGRIVVRPLREIGAVANRIRSGDARARLRMTRRDEVGDLARDFDRMADELLEALNDPLTGVLNHRAFQERLGQELARAEREGRPVALVALDIDDFKLVNDGLGHAAGDDALRALAVAIRGELRAGDVCGRVGGDEFALALVGADASQATAVIDRVRQRVSRIAVGSARQAITISAGIATFPTDGLTRERLLHLADGAMYWAKSHGKDRCFAYAPDIDFALSPEEAAERNLRAGLVNTVHALARAVDAKDGYTHSHSQRVARYAVALAARTGIAGEHLERIRTAGVLHDVGKIGIRDEILLRADKLELGQAEAMRKHSELGHDIISGAGMEDIADWVLHLHERYDGRGYPDALSGRVVPFESRILHCADALEAMTSSRVYRRALPLDMALAELEDGAGRQFDPELAALLVDLVRSGELRIGDGDLAEAVADDRLVTGD